MFATYTLSAGHYTNLKIVALYPHKFYGLFEIAPGNVQRMSLELVRINIEAC